MSLIIPDLKLTTMQAFAGTWYLLKYQNELGPLKIHGDKSQGYLLYGARNNGLHHATTNQHIILCHPYIHIFYVIPISILMQCIKHFSQTECISFLGPSRNQSPNPQSQTKKSRNKYREALSQVKPQVRGWCPHPPPRQLESKTMFIFCWNSAPKGWVDIESPYLVKSSSSFPYKVGDLRRSPQTTMGPMGRARVLKLNLCQRNLLLY